MHERGEVHAKVVRPGDVWTPPDGNPGYDWLIVCGTLNGPIPKGFHVWWLVQCPGCVFIDVEFNFVEGKITSLEELTQLLKLGLSPCDA